MRKIHLFMEGNQIAATWDDFDCLATSPAGFGDVIGEAVADLVKNSSASVMNAIVCGIENERYEERAAENCGTKRAHTPNKQIMPVCPECNGETTVRDMGNGKYKCFACLHEWSGKPA